MNYKLLYVIASWQLKNDLLQMLAEQGCKKLNIMHGKGMGHSRGRSEPLEEWRHKKRKKLDWFPKSSEEKVVIVAMCKSEYVEGVYRRLNTKFGFDKPNSGLAFSLDIGYTVNKEGK